MYALARPFLFCLDAERAHDLGLASIETAYRTGFNALLAARPEAAAGRGIRPPFRQSGRPCRGPRQERRARRRARRARLRLHRSRHDDAAPAVRQSEAAHVPPARSAKRVINRLGFNNGGVDALVRNVERAKFDGVLGINIGKNKDTPNERAVDDYLFCLERVYARASYVTINISSPNTQGLRDLQEEETLKRFIGTLRDAQERLAAQARRAQADAAQDRAGSCRGRARRASPTCCSRAASTA